MLILHLLLYGFIALVTRTLWVLVSPHGRCLRCKGKRVVFSPVRRKRGKCPRCKGRGKRPRVGSRFAHKMLWAIFGDTVRERIRASRQPAQTGPQHDPDTRPVRARERG